MNEQICICRFLTFNFQTMAYSLPPKYRNLAKNPMVGKFVPYLSWKWYCLNVCLNVCLPQKSSKVNKEVEKPPTEEAPSFIRLQENSSIQFIFKSMAIFLWERGYKIISMLSQLFCALDISRKGIVGDWRTHFTSEQSQDWDRLLHWLYNEKPRSSM